MITEDDLDLAGAVGRQLALDDLADLHDQRRIPCLGGAPGMGYQLAETCGCVIGQALRKLAP